MQTIFADLVGVSQPRVSELVSSGVLPKDGTYRVWLHAYTAGLREQAAGRASGELGGLDLVQERAALAREQRVSYEIRNAIARGEFAPTGLLASVLATASQSVSDRFEMLPGQLRKVCPDLPESVRHQIDATIAGARNEWIAATQRIVVEKLIEADEEEAMAEA